MGIKCPNCGGGMVFDIGRQQLVCPYCGATTTPDEKGCCEYCGAPVA